MSESEDRPSGNPSLAVTERKEKTAYEKNLELPDGRCKKCSDPENNKKKAHSRNCPRSAHAVPNPHDSEEVLEPEVPEPPEDLAPESEGQGTTPLALQKLHRRLKKDIELYKLHIKHYHMNLNQFRKRTSQLALPEEIYDKYKQVCQGCTVCNKQRPAPSRSRISGIRAENFGDIIFVDHCEINFRKHPIAVLLVMDGASNLLWGHVQRDLSSSETLSAIREYMSQTNCVPK